MQKSLVVCLCVLSTFVLIEARPGYGDYGDYGYSSGSDNGYHVDVGYDYGGGNRGRGGFIVGARGGPGYTHVNNYDTSVYGRVAGRGTAGRNPIPTS